MSRMLRNLVGVKRAVGDADLKKYVSVCAVPSYVLSLKHHIQLVQTLLDQAHLSPISLSVQPTLWEYDQALRLYPMPTAVSCFGQTNHSLD